MKSSLVIAIALGIIVAQSHEGECSRRCFAQICSSNRLNLARGCDDQGCGRFHAPRSTRRDGLHKGIDIVCDAGSDIYSPIPGSVIGPGRPLATENPRRSHNVGIHIRGTGIWADFNVKMFYTTMKVGIGATVNGNTVIGEMTNMAAEYKRDGDDGMTNHVHVQIERRGEKPQPVDPSPFFC